MRADVFPHDFLAGRYLEQSAEAPFGYQSVPVGEAPGARDVRTVEIQQWTVAVFPRDRIGSGIHFDHSREALGEEPPAGPVVKNEGVAIGQQVRIVLLR